MKKKPSQVVHIRLPGELHTILKTKWQAFRRESKVNIGFSTYLAAVIENGMGEVSLPRGHRTPL